MSIHDFDFSQFNVGQEVQQNFVGTPKQEVGVVSTPAGVPEPGYAGNRQHDERNLDECSNCESCNAVEDNIDVNFVEEVRETYPAGFKLMDKGIKNYFSGVRVPVGKGTEEFRMMPVRFAGAADPEALVYSDNHILGGRLTLPMLSITRTSENYDNKRYTPPIGSIARHMICNGKKSELIYRPAPYLIDYILEIWAEHKSDAEYALFAIMGKINPIGSFFMEDPSMGMAHEVIVTPGGTTDNSDLESDAETKAQIKKAINIKVEGWLPTPTKIVNNVLATPVSIRENVTGQAGDIYFINRGVGEVSGNH
jgi:hypothetical protein